MLSSQHRLLTPLPRTALSIRSETFLLKYGKNGLETSRFGFVVSKRISKSAVIRNRTKRVFRSVVEQNLGKIQKGYDMLFIIQRSLDAAHGVEHELSAALRKANLWE